MRKVIKKIWQTSKFLFVGTIGFSVGFLLLAYNAEALSVFQEVQGGTGTTTAPIGQILYGGSGSVYQSVATTSVTCSGSASCSSFTVIGSSPITISATGGGGSGTVSTSSSETATQIPFWTSTNGTPALLSGGTSNFTWTNTTNLLSITGNASTTQLTATNSVYLATTGGKAAVGTTTPSTIFHVAGAGNVKNQVTIEDTAGTANNHLIQLGSVNGTLKVDTVTDAGATTTQVTISSASNALAAIGTSTPGFSGASLIVTNGASASTTAVYGNVGDSTSKFQHEQQDSTGATHCVFINSTSQLVIQDGACTF